MLTQVMLYKLQVLGHRRTSDDIWRGQLIHSGRHILIIRPTFHRHIKYSSHKSKERSTKLTFIRFFLASPRLLHCRCTIDYLFSFLFLWPCITYPIFYIAGAVLISSSKSGILSSSRYISHGKALKSL